jgi:hypothetical protein
MLGSSGTGGASGSGTGGTTGVAGGTGGTLPACGGAGGTGDSVELAIVGADGTLLGAAVQAAVTVTSVDSCMAVTCPESFTGSFPIYLGPHVSKDATRIVLAGASSQQWTIYVRNTSMPASIVHVGDAFDMTVAAALTDYSFGVVRQTAVLAHGSDLVLFAHASAGISGVAMPSLSDFQIDVTAGVPYCETTSTGQPLCGDRNLAAGVTLAGQSANLLGGQTARVGWLSFTNGVSSDGFGDSCHTISYRAMAGFRHDDGTGRGGGSAGNGAGGGSAGTGGTSAGGGGGTGGTLPACEGSSATGSVVVAFMGSDGMLVAAPTTAAVTIASLESCGVVTCPPGAGDQANKIVLTAGQQQWALYLRNTSMPPATIKVGDTFDLTVDASVGHTPFAGWVNQTIVLARDGNLMLFAASLAKYAGLAVPQLEAFGIAITDYGAVCEGGDYALGCVGRTHAARVAVGGDAAFVPGRQVATAGWLSLTNGGFTEQTGGSCDAPSFTRIAGFRLP